MYIYLRHQKYSLPWLNNNSHQKLVDVMANPCPCFYKLQTIEDRKVSCLLGKFCLQSLPNHSSLIIQSICRLDSIKENVKKLLFWNIQKFIKMTGQVPVIVMMLCNVGSCEVWIEYQWGIISLLNSLDVIIPWTELFLFWRDQSYSPPEWLQDCIFQPVSRSWLTLLKEKVQNLKNIIFNLFRSGYISGDCCVKLELSWYLLFASHGPSGLLPFNFNISAL